MKLVLRAIAVILFGVAIFYLIGANSDQSELIGMLPEKDQAIAAAAMNQANTQFLVRSVVAGIGGVAAWIFSSKFK